MALPATDDFNRANGPVGANWAGSVGGDLNVAGTAYCVGASTGADNSMYWVADTPDANHLAQVKLNNYNVSCFYGPTVRHSATDFVLLDAYTAWRIEWYNGATWTVIGSAYEVSPAAGDTGKITANGSTFKGYVNTVERISGSNGSAPATGSGGLYNYSNGAQLDDFLIDNLAVGYPAIRKMVARPTEIGRQGVRVF